MNIIIFTGFPFMVKNIVYKKHPLLVYFRRKFNKLRKINPVKKYSVMCPKFGHPVKSSEYQSKVRTFTCQVKFLIFTWGK